MFDSWLSFLYALSQCQICIALNSTESSPLSSNGREMNATSRNPLDSNVQKVSRVKHMLQGRVVSFIWCITALTTAQWSQEAGFLSNNALYWLHKLMTAKQQPVHCVLNSNKLYFARRTWLSLVVPLTRPWRTRIHRINCFLTCCYVVPRFKQLVVTPRVIL